MRPVSWPAQPLRGPSGWRRSTVPCAADGRRIPPPSSGRIGPRNVSWPGCARPGPDPTNGYADAVQEQGTTQPWSCQDVVFSGTGHLLPPVPRAGSRGSARRCLCALRVHSRRADRDCRARLPGGAGHGWSLRPLEGAWCGQRSRWSSEPGPGGHWPTRMCAGILRARRACARPFPLTECANAAMPSDSPPAMSPTTGSTVCFLLHLRRSRSEVESAPNRLWLPPSRAFSAWNLGQSCINGLGSPRHYSGSGQRGWLGTLATSRAPLYSRVRFEPPSPFDTVSTVRTHAIRYRR